MTRSFSLQKIKCLPKSDILKATSMRSRFCQSVFNRLPFSVEKKTESYIVYTICNNESNMVSISEATCQNIGPKRDENVRQSLFYRPVNSLKPSFSKLSHRVSMPFNLLSDYSTSLIKM